MDSESANVTYKLRKFEMKSMQADKTVLLLGKRNTGKSTLLEDILYYLKDAFDIGFGMTLTQDTARSFRKYMPDTLIYNNGVDQDRLTEIVNMLRKISETDETGENKITVYGVLDDIASQKGVFNSETMRDIFMNGRHYHMFFVVLMQYVMDMGPSIRSQIDYLFVLRNTSVEDRKKIWKNFFGMFSSFEEFCEVFDACTDEYDCIVLDNTVRSNRVEDVVFWYRAKPKHPKFTLCNRTTWKLHYMFYEPPKVDFNDDGCPIPALAGQKKKEELKRQQEDGGPGEHSDNAVHESTDKSKTTTKGSATAGSNATSSSGLQKRRTAAKKKGMSVFNVRVEKRDENGDLIIPLPPPTPAFSTSSIAPIPKPGHLHQPPPALTFTTSTTKEASNNKNPSNYHH